MKKLFTLLSLVCALFCTVACSSPNSTPTSITEAYMDALQSEDYEAITELFYFDEANPEEAAEGKQMITSLISKVGPEMEKRGGIESYEIVSETISEDGESADVDVKVTYGNGNVENQTSETVQHDGKWYLHFGK